MPQNYTIDEIIKIWETEKQVNFIGTYSDKTIDADGNITEPGRFARFIKNAYGAEKLFRLSLSKITGEIWRVRISEEEYKLKNKKERKKGLQNYQKWIKSICY